MLLKEDIIKYYDDCEKDYRLFWDLDRSLAMHAGYWDKTTKNLQEALIKENEVLVEIAKIKKGERVLDAGCGIGGSSIYLAKKHHCNVVGITLSQKQVEKARTYALNLCSGSLPEFTVMDYSKTQFPDESFDVVWGVESICHAADKKAFLKEAFRILKKGGRIVIADGFASNEDRIDQKWLKGWGVNRLESVKQFSQHMKTVGFSNVCYQDATKNALPSSKRLFWISIPAFFFSKVGEILKFRTKLQTENIKSAFYQYRAIKKRQWQYGIFYAEK